VTAGQATAKLISSDGWVHTGDVMEKRGDSYVYIDRKNQVIKLAQGEYVAISRLEVRAVSRTIASPPVARRLAPLKARLMASTHSHIS
jgi:long-subunit acyl-CoA synthetase (AMP-forming)